MPKITILITAYKDRGWIPEAIESAINQTFDDYDIILCSDGNEEIVKYAEQYDIPFYLSPKGNYSTLVNNAVNVATGEWIKVLHDDDILTENCLNDLYNSRGDSDLVYGNAFIFCDNDRVNFRQYNPPSELSIKTFLPIITNPVNFEAELFKKETFLKIGGFDTNLGYTEDYDLLLNLIIGGYKLTYCDSSVVWYRHHDRQITGNEPEMRQKERDYLFNKHMNNIIKLNWKS